VTTNQALAVAAIERLLSAGVRTFCVCPGGRNAPLVDALDALPPGVADVLPFFDERSAGFFALGRARRDSSPVAIVTTSGTAAAELLPPMVEGYYSSVPVVALTADRPRACRGSGAPQAIEQVNLFGTYATVSLDAEHPDELNAWPSFDGPGHINLCFAEPLLADWDAAFVPDGGRAGVSPGEAPAASSAGKVWDEAPASPTSGSQQADVDAFLTAVRSPLVIVGGLPGRGDAEAAQRFCHALGAPVLAEASSGVRRGTLPGLLRSGDDAARRGFEQGLFDSVVRVGDVPSFRVWRDLDLSLRVPVLSVSRKRWRGLTRGTHVQVPAGAPLPLEVPVSRPPAAGSAELVGWDRRLAGAADRLLQSLPQSEPALVRRLSEIVPAGSFVYLGNSLPIREWNRFATLADREFLMGENRGANGIDGQVASFLGWARPDVENWAVVGDLTALYDLSALWALRHLEAYRLRIVVVNNGGGRIFQRMYRNQRFQNRHQTGFAAWASMWGADYYDGLPSGAIGASAVIELRPDEAETDALWDQLGEEARR
jgi:2-succinyl-5-enolpyruvyl-6-hydroxy-3-cyclohexene-1-carboxylate synthase